MKVNFEDGRNIRILINTNKDIVIFPLAKTKMDEPLVLADGTVIEDTYAVAYYPIELKYPYTIEELAEKIEFGISQWDKHECYPNFSGRNTFEEKYYGVKGFKNAVKGVRMINLGWDDIAKKYLRFYFPLKRGYGYLGLDRTRLDDDADWIDFAEAVMNYVNMDITQLRSYKTFKSKLNI